MPQISAEEFHAAPLRAHAFLAGVPLHDAWAVDLPKLDRRVTLAELNPLEPETRAIERPGLVRALFAVRLFLGRVFGLESEPDDAGATSFVARLTPEDHARSSLKAGTRLGLFRVVYRFENEQLLELHNRTAHAAALSALAETEQGYRFYFGVYVTKASWFTPIYMALIAPFRKWIVYPAMLRNIEAAWHARR